MDNVIGNKGKNKWYPKYAPHIILGTNKSILDTMKSRKEQIESFINMNDEEIKGDYLKWDKGDCSEVGLCEILLKQLIKEHKQENGEYYDSDYDQIKLRY